MSDEHREYHVHGEAADELENQANRARQILERLAADLAAAEPRRRLEWQDLVEKCHVLSAAEQMFGSATPVKDDAQRNASPVFLSYSHDDEEFASELTSRLEKIGIRVFKANRDIRPASIWIESLRIALSQSRVLALVLTSRYLKSDWCRFESGAAFACNKKLLVILRHVDTEDVPEPLREFQSITVESSRQLDEFIRIVREMCAD